MGASVHSIEHHVWMVLDNTHDTVPSQSGIIAQSVTYHHTMHDVSKAIKTRSSPERT